MRAAEVNLEPWVQLFVCVEHDIGTEERRQSTAGAPGLTLRQVFRGKEKHPQGARHHEDCDQNQGGKSHPQTAFAQDGSRVVRLACIDLIDHGPHRRTRHLGKAPLLLR